MPKPRCIGRLVSRARAKKSTFLTNTFRKKEYCTSSLPSMNMLMAPLTVRLRDHILSMLKYQSLIFLLFMGRSRRAAPFVPSGQKSGNGTAT